MNKRIILILVLAMVLILSACSKDTSDNSDAIEPSKVSLQDHILTIYYDGDNFAISAEAILNMSPVTLNVTNISSSGEIDSGEIKGVTLNSILAQASIVQQDYDEITLKAADGYSMMVPRDIVISKDIYIIWEYKGEALSGIHYPIRAAIADERSMYWVGQLNEIILTKTEANREDTNNGVAKDLSISKLVLMDNAVQALESIDYTYYESIDKAVSFKDLDDKFSVSQGEGSTIRFIAADGFTKTETLSVFHQGYLKYTGDSAPLFLAPEMPKGMHVKYILSIDNGRGTSYLSGDKAYEYFGDRLVNIIEMDSVPLLLIEELSKLSHALEYRLVALDGYEKIINRALFEKGALYKDAKGNFGISFDGLEPRERVKDILYIEAIKGN